MTILILPTSGKELVEVTIAMAPDGAGEHGDDRTAGAGKAGKGPGGVRREGTRR